MTSENPANRSSTESPALAWDRTAAQRTLDELFIHARHYRSSNDYRTLLEFISRFPLYAPYNAMLIHAQMPGAVCVASPAQWNREYRRRIKPGERPIVILRRMGPVMFVFDISQTEPTQEATPVPAGLMNPFQAKAGRIGKRLPSTISNAVRDGVRTYQSQSGSQQAGQIGLAQPGLLAPYLVKRIPVEQYVQVRVVYELGLSAELSAPSQYATLCHELGHLYLGHLGTLNPKWWPDRRGGSEDVREFEAESVCHLVCNRLGIISRSAEYLAFYLDRHSEIPPISLDCVLKAAGLIEQMGLARLPPR
jgi:hypothetical protein